MQKTLVMDKARIERSLFRYAFWQGVESVYAFGMFEKLAPTKQGKSKAKFKTIKDDQIALMQDWIQVGNDLKVAMKDFETLNGDR